MMRMSASGLCGERESSEFKRNLNGGPQADGFVGKQQLSSIGQQLKEKIFFNCRYIAGNCCSRKRVGGLWSAIAINDQQLKEYIYIDGHRWRSAGGRGG